MATGALRVEADERVAILTLDRPAKRNALDDALWRAFHDALRSSLADPKVHAVLVTGADGNFCAGTDLTDLEAVDPHAPTGGHPAEPVIDLLCEFHKPLVAAADGVAVGFGLTFLLHCDAVFITPRTRLRAPFVKLGVVPEAASTALLPMQIGSGAAAEILLSAQFVDAERALALGIAQHCVAPTQLLEAALTTAHSMAAHPLAALEATKRLLLASRREQVLAAKQREGRAFLELLRGSPDAGGDEGA